MLRGHRRPAQTGHQLSCIRASAWQSRNRRHTSSIPLLPHTTARSGDWKRAGALEQLLIQRALRPDRQAQATAQFVSASLGPEYVQGRAWGLEEAGHAAGPCVPMLLFLSQGVDVAGMVEAYATGHDRGAAAGSFDSVSMGQGQVRAGQGG